MITRKDARTDQDRAAVRRASERARKATSGRRVASRLVRRGRQEAKKKKKPRKRLQIKHASQSYAGARDTLQNDDHGRQRIKLSLDVFVSGAQIRSTAGGPSQWRRNSSSRHRVSWSLLANKHIRRSPELVHFHKSPFH